jgi:hypothetical protein
VLLLGLSATAQAVVPIFEVNEDLTTSGFVANAYAFTLNAPGWYDVNFTDLGGSSTFEGVTLNILRGFTTTGPSLGGISGFGNFSFFADAAGAYTALLFGGLNHPGTVSFDITVVPEVETWVMMLVGVGLIAYQLRRKNKSLGRPTLSFS